jgi:hypothetical protein
MVATDAGVWDDWSTMRKPGAVDIATEVRRTGRLGSWHSYRWQWWIAGFVMALAIPWHLVAPGQRADVITVNVVVGLAWAIPVWRCGVTVNDRGVRFTGVLFSRVYRWDSISQASVGWYGGYGVEPRLLLELVDGEEQVAPGFRMPKHQAYRRDLWRDSQMFAAAELISEEAELRRAMEPPDGDLVPVPTPLRRPRPAPVAA